MICVFSLPLVNLTLSFIKDMIFLHQKRCFMKKTKALPFTLLSLAALSLSGCSQLFSLFGGKVKVTDLNPMHLKDTYNDYLNNNFFLLSGTPLSGQPKLLVIPVWFTDSNKYIPSDCREQVREDIEKCYFGADKEVGWKSVSSYYKELSQNKVTLNGTVSNWYECGNASNYFYSSDVGQKRTTQLVSSAVDWYFSNHSYESKQSYDTDGDGYYDGVMLIYASPDYGALNNNNAQNMWAYCFWMQQAPGTASNPLPNVFFWASYDFMYGASGFDSGSRVGLYGSGDTSNCKLDTHTFIHEMGHVFGLEDYYDYSNQYTPAGGFSMQDYNVGSHDPYSVMAFGWADPMIPKSTCSLSIRPFQESHDLVLLSFSPNSVVSPFDEYLLLEYYTPSGLNSFDVNYQYARKYPQGSVKSGIRLWHVDGRLLCADSREESARISMATYITKGKYYTHTMSNTYYDENDETSQSYISPLGKQYADYNILQLIRNNRTDNYYPGDLFNEGSLFLAGSSFNMKNFKKQFVEGERMNNGSSLDWSFKVNKITSSEAVVTFTRG